MTNYQWRNGSRIRGGVDAQAAGEELDRIRDKHNGLQPQDVVDESKPDEAPLHPCFEWDDAAAANEHRKHQARTLVRSIEVVYPEAEPEPAFIHVEPLAGDSAGSGYYERGRTVAMEFDLYSNAWKAAQERLASAAQSLHELESLAAKHASPDVVAKVRVISAAQSKVTEASELLNAS